MLPLQSATMISKGWDECCMHCRAYREPCGWTNDLKWCVNELWKSMDHMLM